MEYEDILRKSRKTDDEKADDLIDMLEQSEGIWEGICPWVKDCRQEAIGSSVRTLRTDSENGAAGKRELSERFRQPAGR